jgi:hypothetical protein
MPILDILHWSFQSCSLSFFNLAVPQETYLNTSRVLAVWLPV